MVDDAAPAEPMSERHLVDRRRLEQLLELGRRMSAARSMEELLGVVTRAAPPLVDADRATLYIYNAAGNEIWSKIATELEIKEIRLAVGEGAAGVCAATRAPVNVADAKADPRTRAGAIDART